MMGKTSYHAGLAAALLLGGTALATGSVPAAAADPQTAQAPAVAPTQTFTFAIAAQPLPRALAALSATAGLRVLYTVEEPYGITGQAVNGTFTASEALARLLGGTGFTYRFTTQDTVTLEKAAGSGAMVLDPVTVEGKSATGRPSAETSATAPMSGYVARRSATATKTDAPIIETPQTVNVVTADQMRDQKAQSLDQALAYTPGIVAQEGADRTGDMMWIRGFQAHTGSGSVLRDGMRYSMNVFDGAQETYGLERVEVLKGAASVLFGAAAPGGVINTVSKRPTLDPLHEINLELGSYDHRQVSTDHGGKLTADGTWSYRLTALARDADTFVDHVEDDREYFAPAITWRPDGDTSFTLLSHYQNAHTAYVYGLPAEGTVAPNRNGTLSEHLFTGIPGYDKFDTTQAGTALLSEHAVNDALTLRNTTRYQYSFQSSRETWIWGLLPDERTTAFRGTGGRRGHNQGISTDTQAEMKATTGPVDHTLVAGVDYTYGRYAVRRFSRNASALDLFDPVYTPASGPETYNAYSSRDHMQRVGVYAQDQMKIDDHWVLLLGGRQDWATTSTTPYIQDNWDVQHDDAFSGRVGLVYLFDNGLAPFVSYAESFEPEMGTDRLGNRFEPTTGTQYEAGLRYQPPGSTALITASVYQLTRQNVTTTDPVNPSFSVQTGEVRSRGFELEAKAEVLPHATVTAGYAYTDARITKSNTASDIGKRQGTPYNQASLWAQYAFADFGLPELSIGAGVRYNGPTDGVWMTADVPSYTLADAMVRYDLGDWAFAVNATNLTDESYIASCTYGCFYGEPMKVIGTVSYRW